MRKEKRVDYLEIPATNLAAVQSFFSALFGWTFEDYGPNYCAFSDGRLEGGFRRTENSARAENGSVLIVFYSKNLESEPDRVRAAGGTISQEIFSFPGGRRFHFLDPCGNEYAIWSDR